MLAWRRKTAGDSPRSAGSSSAWLGNPRGGARIMGLRGQELVELLAHPAGVAIVGASSNPQSPSGRPVDYLTRFGFTGSILPVNRRSSQVGGLRAIPDLSEAQRGTVDVALIAVRAPAVVP